MGGHTWAVPLIPTFLLTRPCRILSPEKIDISHRKERPLGSKSRFTSVHVLKKYYSVCSFSFYKTCWKLPFISKSLFSATFNIPFQSKKEKEKAIGTKTFTYLDWTQRRIFISAKFIQGLESQCFIQFFSDCLIVSGRRLSLGPVPSSWQETEVLTLGSWFRFAIM